MTLAEWRECEERPMEREIARLHSPGVVPSGLSAWLARVWAGACWLVGRGHSLSHCHQETPRPYRITLWK